ncbi:MAG: sulfur carrier protein ThiS [Neisseria sp.]|nr:sulfur carrier protein ThiS [Neisseria sp.]
MNISLNNQIITLPEAATLAVLLEQVQPETPFAVSVNTVFVAKTAYAATVLHEGDCVDIVRPVAGG